MKITRLETIMANAGLRNYLFVRLTTDTGLTGLGEASLEWQELTVQTIIHEWVEDRVLGTDLEDMETVIEHLIRDQYNGGSTVLTAISSIEVALWDILGKANHKPVYELLGGKARDSLSAYANGWYGGSNTPEEYAACAKRVVEGGYEGLKFDPFDIAWKDMTNEEMDTAVSRVRAVRSAIGDTKELLIEGHGRLSVSSAIAFGKMIEPYNPALFEEPVSPYNWEGLLEVKEALSCPVAAGERIYMLEEFERFIVSGCADILQPDLSHCGGLSVGKAIARLAAAREMRLSPHVSVGPVALCAAIHFDWATPEVWMQESFSEFDVPWRADLVCGWNLLEGGQFNLPEKPGLGIELDDSVCAAHPYKQHSFPSLWDRRWIRDFTQSEQEKQ